MEEIVRLAREMGKKIQAGPEYARLSAAKEANDNDKELQDMIGKFNMKRIELNTALSKEQKDNDRLNALNEELKVLYQEVMSNKNMAEYNEAKNDVDMMMNQVNAILVMSVNGEDPETCNPAPSCGGSCSSCSGCH